MTTRGLRVVSGAIALHLIRGAVTRHEGSETNDLYMNDENVRIFHRQLRRMTLIQLQTKHFSLEELAKELLCSSSVNSYMHGSPKWLLEVEEFGDFGRNGIIFGNHISGLLTRVEINYLVAILKGGSKSEQKLHDLISRIIEGLSLQKSTFQLEHEF